ncbi:MAG: Rrf2 family transcriptional regulator [Aliishimia sp.]
MQLAKFTDYALRVLMHLAVADKYALSTRQISEIHDARFNHLAKVTQWLSREGYVSSTRGRSGGLRLARSPEMINVGQIVRELEREDALVECLKSDGGLCALSPICGLTSALRTAQDAFFETLDGYTIADLTPPGGHLAHLLERLNTSARPDA